MIRTIEQLLAAYGMDKCTGCQHYHEWQEGHPYGMGTAHESLADCRARSDGQCPRLALPFCDECNDQDGVMLYDDAHQLCECCAERYLDDHPFAVGKIIQRLKGV